MERFGRERRCCKVCFDAVDVDAKCRSRTPALAGTSLRYVCLQARRMQAAERECQGLGGLRLEERIVDAFLAALAPASVDATLAALQETEEAWRQEMHARLMSMLDGSLAIVGGRRVPN